VNKHLDWKRRSSRMSAFVVRSDADLTREALTNSIPLNDGAFAPLAGRSPMIRRRFLCGMRCAGAAPEARGIVERIEAARQT